MGRATVAAPAWFATLDASASPRTGSPAGDGGLGSAPGFDWRSAPLPLYFRGCVRFIRLFTPDYCLKS
jgi:hypothetical protein